MIRIDHTAVYVRDLEGMRSFYQRYFNARSNEGYHNPRTGLRTYFLSFGDEQTEGAPRLEIMSRPDITAPAGEETAHDDAAAGSPAQGSAAQGSSTEGQEQPATRRHLVHGWTHLAFSLGSEEAVNELTERLAADGFTILSGPRRTGDGYWETAFLDPEGNQIEITA